jgi:hypothetical protein
MYRMASGGALVVSPAKAVAASAFQSVITVGSPAAAVAPVAAVAVPVARVASRTPAATAANQLRSCAFRRLVDEEESWRNARV